MTPVTGGFRATMAYIFFGIIEGVLAVTDISRCSMQGRALFVFTVMAVFHAPATFAVPLSKADAEKLATARVNTGEIVALAVVAKDGRNIDAAASTKTHGGVVRFRFDEADYLIVHMPVDEVAAFAREKFIDAVTLDRFSPPHIVNAGLGRDTNPTIGTDELSRDTEIPSRPRWPPPLTAYSLNEPYPFLRDLDAHVLRDEMPIYDGRGVVIAHVERLADVLLPELQSAFDLNGKRVPKFVDVINIPELQPTLDAEIEISGRESWMWTRLSDPRSPRGKHIQQGGIQYKIPRDTGDVRIGSVHISPGILRRIRLPADPPDVGNTGFAVLWSDSRRTAWLDSDRDLDFSDEEPLVEFKSSGQFGILGVDDPMTSVRETVGFAIQKEGDFLSLNFGNGSHATMVAGAAAASAGKTGRIDGIAPGAQLLTIYHGDTASTWGRALITAFADARSDVILIEGWLPVTGLHHLRDGRSTIAILLSRLINLYRKPTVLTGMNRTGLMSISDPIVPNGLMISAYQSRGATFVHSGLIMEKTGGLHSVGAEGPSGDGDFKPDLLSPANPLSLRPGYFEGQGFPGLFKLPPGYAIGGGTSTATPVAAGAIAILVSAAKQEGLPHNAEVINRAMRGSALFLEGIEAYQQGHGLIQVDAALRQLRAIARESEPVKIEIKAPVRTATSISLAQPHVGVGLFEREGWHVGDRSVRTITLTRTAGPEKMSKFDVAWIGNEDQVFEAQSKVSLPLGRQVDIPISISVAKAGAHSAILELRHHSINGPVDRMLATIVAAHDFSAENGFVVEEDFSIHRPGRRNVFFRVPKGADALTIEIKHSGKDMYAQVSSPENQIYKTYLYPNPINGRRSVTFSDPIAGVWQVSFREAQDSIEFDWSSAGVAPPPIPVSLRAAVTGVTIETNGYSEWLGDQAVTSISNRLANFEGATATSALGGMRRVTGEIAPGEQRFLQIDVESGAELLIAEVEPINGERTFDLDLYLFDCVVDICRLAQSARSREGRERVLIERPSPGRWVVVLDATSAAYNESITFSYNDIITHPRYGQLSNSDARISRPIGQAWAPRTHLWRDEAPTKNRNPVAVMYVRDFEAHTMRIPVRFEVSPFPPFGYTNYDEDLVPLGLKIIDLD